MNDIELMKVAIEEAETAFAEGETPIGAVIALDGKIVARAHNRRENDRCATLHAEIMAINEACKKLGGWRLHNCVMYVTLEPCPMCAGAIVSARIMRVVYAAKDAKTGAFGSVLNLNSYPLNHKPHLTCGICEEEASRLMSDFFARIRNNR